MIKVILIFFSLTPIFLFADTNQSISKCANDQDNFSRLACFDKLADFLKNNKKVLKIQGTSKSIANASINEIRTSLSELDRARFKDAMEILVYAKMEFPSNIGKDSFYWISSDLLKTINNKTAFEIIALASESETIKLSKENKTKLGNQLNYKMSEDEALKVIINGESFSSYYDSKLKIKNNDAIVAKLETAYEFLKENSINYKKVVEGQTVGHIIDEAEKLKKELKDYLKKVKIFNLKAKYSDFSEGKFPAIDFKIKNEGKKTLSRVGVTIYFKDIDGNYIYEQEYNPIWTTTYEKETLKPKYIWTQKKGTTFLSKSVPEEWKAGAVDAKVTRVEFKKEEN